VTAPTTPPGWTTEAFPWPEWERTCPRCGRYTRHFHIVSGELLRCAYCGWLGDLPVTRPEGERG
jgi:hypothetical protein